MLECHEVPRLPRKTTLPPALKQSTKKGFEASPIATATAPQKPATRDETCWSIKTSISCGTYSNFTLRSVKINAFLRVFLWTYIRQNQCFVRGFRRFSSPVTKCHPCRGICTLSPLRAALTILTARFAENTQHDTSKVLRLPRKVTSEVFKVLRLLRKMQRIVWKRRKSIAPPHKTTFDTSSNMLECHELPRLPHEMKLRDAGMTPFAELTIGTAIWSSRGRLRTVADVNATSCEHSSTPWPPEWNGNPCYALGKNTGSCRDFAKRLWQPHP